MSDTTTSGTFWAAIHPDAAALPLAGTAKSGGGCGCSATAAPAAAAPVPDQPAASGGSCCGPKTEQGR